VCACKSIIARGYSLTRGLTRSCGCLGNELRGEKNAGHGYAGRKTKAPEYKIYFGIIRRCTDNSSDRSKDYIGRGIRICDRWRHGVGVLSGFECFLADVGHRPSPLHSIDRIDNDGHYEPGNCRWATKAQQGRNRRSNRRLLYRGRIITMTDATLIADVSADAISGRLHRGWSVETAVETPPASRGRGSKRPRPTPNFRFSDDSIRGFVANRWSPHSDPEAISREARIRLGADRNYVKKICRDFLERFNLIKARSAIVRSISTRGNQ
jgi:hypothetical protein